MSDDQSSIGGALGGCLTVIVSTLFIFIVMGPGAAFATILFGGLIWGTWLAIDDD
jgi:hypothetical protein